jgi:hypothetical protein
VSVTGATITAAASTGLIDFGALWKVAVIAFVAALALVVFYALGVLCVSAYIADRETGRRAAAGGLIAGAVCFAACAAIVAFGVYIMLAKG